MNARTSTATAPLPADRLVNLSRYPLHEPGGEGWRALIADAKAQLAGTGRLHMPEFLSSEGLTRIQQEAEARDQEAFHSHGDCVPINHAETAALIREQPQRWDRYGSVRSLGHHQLQDTSMDALYCWEPLRVFIAAATGRARLYLHEDPSNAMMLSAYRQDDQLAWHFDQSHFSTILHVSEAPSGGQLLCVPDLRARLSSSIEPLLEILDGSTHGVQCVPSTAGSLTVLLGSRTLHRITPVQSIRSPRRTIIMAYDETPGQRLDDATRVLYFGPSAPLDGAPQSPTDA